MGAWRNCWSIGIYTGRDPLSLAPPPGLKQPVLTHADVTDVAAESVADPFLLRRDDRWHLFLEVVNGDRRRGEIAYATSEDGLRWTYRQVVLREPYHLSYPQVFEWQDTVYMIPESRQDETVRLYAAVDFPHRWQRVRVLLRGLLADATVLRHRQRWWLFAQRGLDELRLFSAPHLEGGYVEHPASPLRTGNRRYTRPGGRMLAHDGRLLRFAQDGLPTYGSRLRALEIDHLDEESFSEHELAESPLLSASRKGWNAIGMHHLDTQPLADGRWLAAVDGATVRLAR